MIYVRSYTYKNFIFFWLSCLTDDGLESTDLENFVIL